MTKPRITSTADLDVGAATDFGSLPTAGATSIRHLGDSQKPTASTATSQTFAVLTDHLGTVRPESRSGHVGDGRDRLTGTEVVVAEARDQVRATNEPLHDEASPDESKAGAAGAHFDHRPRLRVAIIGAGIGGLSLGIALQERGVQAQVFEQAFELGEIGAAVALSANSLREFSRLGLLDQLAAGSTIPTALIVRGWQNEIPIAVHPVREDSWYHQRFGAPYFGIHRADLQKVLADAFGTNNLNLGYRVVNIVDGVDSVRVEFANGDSTHVDLVVGADGVNSSVRRWVTGAEQTIFSGTTGFRGVVPIEELPSLPDPQAIQLWMGPDAHVVHYPIGGDGGAVNFLAVLRGPSTWQHPKKVVEVDAELPVSSFRGWHPAICEMIKAAASPLTWALFAVRPLLRWHRGRIVIIGDAAHGMLPHHGQGANVSIEDAFALAALLTATDDPLAALPRFQTLRRARTRAIQRSSWVTGSLFHVPEGPMTTARDRKMKTMPQDFAWIHGYDVQEELQNLGVERPELARPIQQSSDIHALLPEEILEQVSAVIAGVVRIESARVTPSASLAADLGIDSLTMVKLVVAIEDEFGAVIPDELWSRFVTVGDLTGHLEQITAIAPDWSIQP